MKKALITGASGGIGLAIANKLAEMGYKLTLVARNEEKLSRHIDKLTGSEHQYIVSDLSTDKGILDLSKHIENCRYDILINNAGVGIYGDFTDIELELQSKMLCLNINALVELSYSFLKNAKTGDALVNIGSVLGSTSKPGASVYAGTKGFVVRFSEGLWDEFRKKGIFVCVFSPGVTSSNFHEVAGGASSNFPQAIQQTPDQVATELIRTLKNRNKPHVVSGRVNRIMLLTYRLLSRKRIVKMMGKF